MKSEKTEDMVIIFASQQEYESGKLDRKMDDLVWEGYYGYLSYSILETKQIYIVATKNVKTSSAYRYSK